MPSNFSYLDTNFPTFERNEGDSSKIAKVQNYLYMLLEQLRYSLSNLDARNFNEAGLSAITDPIYAEIRDAEQGLTTLLELDAGGILAQVAATYETKTAAGELLLEAQQYADGVGSTLSAQVAATYETKTAAGELLLEAQSYADGVGSTLSAQVAATYETKTAAAGILASAQSYADEAVGSLVLYVQNSDGSTSSVSLQGGTISLYGLVSITNLQNGTTTIDGGCIRTGLISSQYIKLEGALGVYSGGSLTGYLGYIQGRDGSGNATYGIGMMASADSGQCYVTGSGARLAYSSDSSVTCTANGVFLASSGNVRITVGDGSYFVFNSTGLARYSSGGTKLGSVLT